MSACPDKELLLHALADNELDAGHALEVEAHVAGCPACAAELAAIRQVKATLGDAQPRYAAPAGLAARIEAALDAESVAAPAPRRVGRVETWVMSGAIGALAASLMLFAVLPQGPGVDSQLVEAQVRSLQAQHLMDVVTSDKHTVKPWFNGKIDFAPPVIDLAAQGYPLAGGRLDYIDQKTAAALVYRRRAHVINLFIWPGQAPDQPQLIRRKGYALVRWGRGGLVYWAVSDVDADDLEGFQKLYAARTGG